MYPLTIDLVNFLLSQPAQHELDILMQDGSARRDTLSVITRLRKTYLPAQAAAIYDQVMLRERAKTKFSNASRMLFTEEALQQATAPEVAQYHTSLFAQKDGVSSVADLGCGIGGDTIAFATTFNVLAVERDPVRCKLAEVNVDVCGLSHQVNLRCADWTTLIISTDKAYIDPSRRISTLTGERKRVFHLDQMQPSLSEILKLQQKVRNVAVKVAPGVNHSEIPSIAEVAFISVDGHMKEALLLFGDLRKGASRTAVLLPGGHIIDSQYRAMQIPICKPDQYLYEPDAAVIRAGLVQPLGLKYDLAQIDSEIAYLTGDFELISPYMKGWYVVKSDGFLLKRLNNWIRELGVGRVVIKKRGSPIDVDKFSRQLKTVKGGPEYTLFLTRVHDRPWMILGEKLVSL